MMTPVIIAFICSGWLSYWVVKIPSTIKGYSPITTVKEFLFINWKEIALSALVLAATIVEGGQQVNTPLAAIGIGLAIPSTAMNLFSAFGKKQ